MALSSNSPRTFEEGLEFGDVLVAASTTIYDGAIVGLSSGYARGLVAGDAFAGVATHKRDNSSGAAGALKVRVRRRGYLVMNVTGASALTDKGKDVYASADDTLTLTQGSNSPVGKVHRWISGTQCSVYFDADLVSGDLPNHQHTAGTDGGPLTSPRIVTSIADSAGNALIKVGTNALGFFNTTAATQPAHIADPAQCAAMTADLVGVDTGTDMTAAQAATIVADLGALKTAVDANNAAIDSILAQLATLGLQAAS